MAVDFLRHLLGSRDVWLLLLDQNADGDGVGRLAADLLEADVDTGNAGELQQFVLSLFLGGDDLLADVRHGSTLPARVHRRTNDESILPRMNSVVCALSSCLSLNCRNGLRQRLGGAVDGHSAGGRPILTLLAHASMCDATPRPAARQPMSACARAHLTVPKVNSRNTTLASMTFSRVGIPTRLERVG